jgi:hypothetical protein
MYNKEFFPDNIKFVEDTPQNRQTFYDLLGLPKFILSTDWSYIEIDTKEKSWRTHLSVFWLYRNEPPLIDVVDAITILK